MKKDMIRGILVAAVTLVLYILVVFLFPFEHNAIFWVSVIFTLIAFAVVAASVYMAFIKNPDTKSRFYGFPLARVGVIYGGGQMVASLLVMALSELLPWWIPVLVYALGLGAAAIGLISVEAVVDEIKHQDIKLKKNVALMRSLQSKVSQMAAQSEDAALKALAEEFRFSDPVSNAAIAEAEADLTAAVDELQEAYVDGDGEAVKLLCRKVDALLAERNRLCKLNKQ